MDFPGRLLVVLASFSILSWMVAFAGPTQPPILSLVPQNPIYTQGEEITLVCSAPEQLVVAGYIFYEERGNQTLEVLPEVRKDTFRLDGTAAGTFHCVYQILESGQEFQSQRSNSVSVVRTELPQPPVLSIHPQFPIYIKGEDVVLTCSAPGGLTLAGYELYENVENEISSVHLGYSHTFKLKVEKNRRYNCTYWAVVSRRKIRSQWSNSIFLAWTDLLPPPALEVSPPPRAVYEGETLLISCLSNSNNIEKRFRFYRDGVEMDSSDEDSLRSSTEPGDPSPDATLRIPQFNSNHSGGFSCSYEENMNGRWVPSHWSKALNVSVQPRDSPRPVLMYVRLAFVLLIPLISLVYFCHSRRKRGEEEFHPQKSKEEIEFIHQGNLVPQRAALQSETRLQTTEENRVLYCEIVAEDLHKIHRPKPGDMGRVSYKEIQFQPARQGAR